MPEFQNPTVLTKDTSAKSQDQRFRAEHPTKSWYHQIVGGEHVMVLVFAANRAVSSVEAKQLATLVENQRGELTQSGAMLACTLPEAAEFPEGKDVHFGATFELKTAMTPEPPPK